jgi:hypothetical protein
MQKLKKSSGIPRRIPPLNCPLIRDVTPAKALRPSTSYVKLRKLNSSTNLAKLSKSGHSGASTNVMSVTRALVWPSDTSANCGPLYFILTRGRLIPSQNIGFRPKHFENRTIWSQLHFGRSGDKWSDNLCNQAGSSCHSMFLGDRRGCEPITGCFPIVKVSYDHEKLLACIADAERRICNRCQRLRTKDRFAAIENRQTPSEHPIGID